MKKSLQTIPSHGTSLLTVLVQKYSVLNVIDKIRRKEKVMRLYNLFIMMICVAGLNAAYAEVKLPPVLSSHMVLQRGMKVPVWGTALPGEKVTVKFRNQEKSTTADAQGKWKVSLDSLKAGGPDVLTVVGSNTLKLEDVLVGEVWLGSGQSNMFGGAGEYVKNDEVLAKMVAAGPYPKLRLIRLDSSTWTDWKEATPDHLMEFSAQLFSFGCPLQKELNVPVGLLVGAAAGKPSGYFLSEEAFNSDQACQDLVASQNYDEAVKKHEVAMEKWKKDLEKAKAEGVEENKLPKSPWMPKKVGTTWANVIGNLYERIIRPGIPYGIRGVLWDQGESGTGICGIDQYTVMGALIKSWRKDWGQDFPFIYVQKPSGGGCAWDTTDPVTSQGQSLVPLPDQIPGGNDAWANYIQIRTYPDTFMSTSSDLSPTTDPTSEQLANGIKYNNAGMHPENKSGYGARAARVALGGVYGKDVEIYGPVYKSYKIEGNKVIISFDHVGKGLVFKKGESIDTLQGFTISGDAKNFNYNRPRFFWADAVIEGDTIVVSSDKVLKPVAVRYAWAEKRPWANLFNKDGLPALPFSTYESDN
jgi:sialate O-acetylesterase